MPDLIAQLYVQSGFVLGRNRSEWLMGGSHSPFLRMMVMGIRLPLPKLSFQGELLHSLSPPSVRILVYPTTTARHA